MRHIIRIIGLRNGEPTPYDGQYLKEYDPTRDGISPDGEPINAYLVTTPNKRDAKRFDSFKAAMMCWERSHGKREDGLPNRPLTAFTVEFI